MHGKMKLKKPIKKRIKKTFIYIVIIYLIFSITFYYSLKKPGVKSLLHPGALFGSVCGGAA